MCLDPGVIEMQTPPVSLTRSFIYVPNDVEEPGPRPDQLPCLLHSYLLLILLADCLFLPVNTEMFPKLGLRKAQFANAGSELHSSCLRNMLDLELHNDHAYR